MEGFTTPEGGTNWDLISMLLGQTGQAFSAQDPTSWQHQVGGMAKEFGQSKLYGKAATKAAAEQKNLADAIRELARGGLTPMDMEGLNSMKVGNNKLTFEVNPGRDFDYGVLGGAGAFDQDPFGVGPLSTSGVPQGAESSGMFRPLNERLTPASMPMGAPTSTPTGGAGGQDVFSPFRQAYQGE